MATLRLPRLLHSSLISFYLQVARGSTQYVARIIYPGDPTLGDKLLATGNLDWLAFVLVLVLTGVVTWGVQESAFLVMGKWTDHGSALPPK